MTTSQPSRTCTHHEGAPGIAICTECGGDICAACHGSDLRGYCVCSACRQEFAPPTTPWEDPNEDYSPRAFGRTLVDVVTSPRTFFQKVRFSHSWIPAVAFAAICMTLGFLFRAVWNILLWEPVAEHLTQVAEQTGTTLEVVRLAMFAAVPIQVALVFLIHTSIFHLAVKLAGGHTSFGLSSRIIGYAAAGYVFLTVPPIGEFALGHFLAIIWIFNIEMGALRMYFQMGMWRSMFVVMGSLLLMLPFMGG